MWKLCVTQRNAIKVVRMAAPKYMTNMWTKWTTYDSVFANARWTHAGSFHILHFGLPMLLAVVTAPM